MLPILLHPPPGKDGSGAVSSRLWSPPGRRDQAGGDRKPMPFRAGRGFLRRGTSRRAAAAGKALLRDPKRRQPGGAGRAPQSCAAPLPLAGAYVKAAGLFGRRRHRAGSGQTGDTRSPFQRSSSLPAPVREASGESCPGRSYHWHSNQCWHLGQCWQVTHCRQAGHHPR